MLRDLFYFRLVFNAANIILINEGIVAVNMLANEGFLA